MKFSGVIILFIFLSGYVCGQQVSDDYSACLKDPKVLFNKDTTILPFPSAFHPAKDMGLTEEEK